MVEHGTAERDHALVTFCGFSLVLQRRVERRTEFLHTRDEQFIHALECV